MRRSFGLFGKDDDRDRARMQRRSTGHLDGEIRDGRHHMQVRVYCEISFLSPPLL